MLNLNKHSEFFDPMKVEDEIHIIGIGAIGSTVVNQLVRLGFTNIHLYDFDTVSDHNIANQLYIQEDIGMLKTQAMLRLAKAINPEINITLHEKGWVPKTKLQGHLILALDSIDLRRQILEENINNFKLISVMDIRMGLEEAQTYFADATSGKDLDALLSTMNFKDDEVVSVVSACGTTLSVLPTIQMIVSIAVMNLLNFIKNKEYNTSSFVDSLQGKAVSYKH